MATCLEPEIIQSMTGDETPIFLATLDADGLPNCVPVTSIAPYAEDEADSDAPHVAFAEFLLNKTRKNLQHNDHVGIAVFNQSYESWSIKGHFLGFEATGDRIDWVNQMPLLRYNAYTSARTAGLIRIDDVAPQRKLTQVEVLRRFAQARIAAPFLRGREEGRTCMPLPVEEKFRRIAAVRAIAFRGQDGFPRALTVMACVAAGPNRLLVSDPNLDAQTESLEAGIPIAAAVLSMEPIAYQVKGVYAGRRFGFHVIDLDACYSASPPLPGERLDTRRPLDGR
jgi:pyridoxamine 5'-phosphate oxidase-like protein